MSFSLDSSSLTGGPNTIIPILTQYEYTSGDVATQYNNDLATIAGIYNTPSTTNSDGTITPPTLTAAEAAAVYSALNDMYNLAINGKTDSSGRTWYLSDQMATNLDQLARSLESVGFPIPNGSSGTLSDPTSALAALNEWKDLTTLSPVITQVLVTGSNLANTNQSLQAMIELDYVQTANSLVESQLGSLQQALTTTNSALNVLAAIQSIHNNINVSSKPPFNFNYSGTMGANSFEIAYKTAASAYYGTPVQASIPNDIILHSHIQVSTQYPTTRTSINQYFQQVVIHSFLIQYSPVPIVSLTPHGLSLVNQLISLRQSLTNEIAWLSVNLSASQKAGAGNLYSQLKLVVQDLDTTFVDSKGNPLQAGNKSTAAEKQKAISNWLLDGYNSSSTSSSGAIQTNITGAITAAQSLSSTQNQSVRNYMFVFQQYYQSASAILQAITQLIQKMAQHISS